MYEKWRPTYRISNAGLVRPDVPRSQRRGGRQGDPEVEGNHRQTHRRRNL